MDSKHRKAIVITPFWAGVLGSLLVVAISGSYVYAWTNNAAFAVVQDKVIKIDGANLDVRMAKLEQLAVAVNDSLGRIERKQDKTDDKVSQILAAKRQ